VCTLCYSEAVEGCGSREIYEETGLKLKDMKTDCILNVIWQKEQRHFVAVVLHGEVDTTKQKEPDTLEPQKCEGTRYGIADHYIFNLLILPRRIYTVCWAIVGSTGM